MQFYVVLHISYALKSTVDMQFVVVRTFFVVNEIKFTYNFMQRKKKQNKKEENNF